MKKLTLLVIAMSIIVVSCKKDKKIDDPIIPEKKISWWAINNDTFRTTVTEKYINSSSFNIHYQNATNDTTFSITIDTANRNLNNDSFKIYGVMYSGSQVTTYFNGHEGTYMPGPYDSGMVYSIRTDGRVKFILPPTIFRKLIPVPSGGLTPSEDTTMIQGEFYEP